jgi:hypothetical protein
MEFFIWHGLVVLGICLTFFGLGYITARKQLSRQ